VVNLHTIKRASKKIPATKQQRSPLDGLQQLQTIWLLTTCSVCAPNLFNGHCEFAKQVDDLGAHLHNIPYDAAE
jgi:hypothetical protein